MNEYFDPPYEERRQVQKLIDNQWININLKNAEVGDVIRFIEPDGKILLNDFNKQKWKVLKETFRREKDNRWTVKCESLK